MEDYRAYNSWKKIQFSIFLVGILNSYKNKKLKAIDTTNKIIFNEVIFGVTCGFNPR